MVAASYDGFANAAAQQPWSPHTRSQIASISKQFTAVVALMLVARAVITLDDPVAEVMPDCPSQWNAVTIRQLITHTAGVSHWCDLPGFRPAEALDPAQRLEQLLAGPLTNRPGRRWLYSSPGYIVLAAVLESAAHTPYSQLVIEHILIPLGLTEMIIGRRPTDDVALGYRCGRLVPAWPLDTMPGTGDICCSANDLARFVTALHEGTLLPAGVQPLLHHLALRQPVPQAPASIEQPTKLITTTHYCAGHFHGTVNGRPAYLHPGDNPGYQSLAAWLPDANAVIVALSNDEHDDIDKAVDELARETAG